MQIEVSKREVARYLGYKNEKLDAGTEKDIEKCEKMLKDCISPKAYYKVCELEKTDEIAVKNTSLTLRGNSAKSLLEGCDKCVLMIVTLGEMADQLLRKLQITNMPLALTADFCASSLAEDLANKFEEQIKSEVLKDGEFFTDRFSPGYGDMDISIQKAFCEVLQSSKTVGVSVASGGIMIPRKTITAVIGIANKPQKMRIKGCKYCDFFSDCEYRKDGGKCD